MLLCPICSVRFYESSAKGHCPTCGAKIDKDFKTVKIEDVMATLKGESPRKG